MRVHCDNCKAAYEIEDSRVPESGLAVKCSKCNTLFVVKTLKVQPEIVEPVTLSPVEEENVDWDAIEKSKKKFKGFILRRPDGRTYPFQEMATLQRWVVERKALKTDEMTDDGENWRKLADIRELDSFFAVVGSAAGPASVAAQQTPTQIAPAEERPRMTMQMWAQPAEKEAESEKPHSSGVVQESIASTFSGDESPAEAKATEKPLMPRAVPEQPKVESAAKAPSKEDFEDTRITPIPEKPTDKDSADAQKAQFPPRDEKPLTSEKVELPLEEETKKRKSGGILSAKRSNTDEFDLEKWEALADDDSSVAGKKGKIIAVVAVLLLLLAAAVFMFVPQAKGLLFEAATAPEDLAKLESARAAMNQFSDEKLAEAAAIVKPLLESKPELSQAWALMTEITSTRIDLLGYKLEEAEKFQNEADARIKELKSAYESAKSQAEKDRLRSEMEKAGLDLNAANQAVAQAANRVNEQIAQLDSYAAKCLELAPEALETNRALADFYRTGAQAAKSGEYLEKALKQNPDDAPSLYVKGSLSSNDPALLDDAVEFLRAAVAADATLIKARFRLAYILVKSEKLDEARSALDGLLAVQPDHQPALDLMAALKKPEDGAAAQAAETAIPAAPEGEAKKESKPAAPSSYEEFMRAGDALRNSDNPNAALGNYKKAWELKQTVNAATGLGFCYYDLFNYKEALNYFKKASGMSSGDQATLIGLAMTYDKLNDGKKALEYYKIYLRNFPRGEDALFAKNAVERLQAQQQ